MFDARGVVVDKMDRATYLSRHLFQTTQRNQRRLSGSPSSFPFPPSPPVIPRPPFPPCFFPFLLPSRRFFSFPTSSIERERERMACRSRLSIQMGLAYRDRADHPLFPRRTTPSPMNNASSRGNRYADCRSVPTYTLFLRLSHAAAIQDTRIWVSGNLISVPFFLSLPLLSFFFRYRDYSLNA